MTHPSGLDGRQHHGQELDERAHDLPPRWNGLAVVWSPWSDPQPRPFLCPPGPGPHGCTRCGSVGAILHTRGHVARIGAGGRAQLHATRCADCGADQILDDAGQSWDLDPEDYGDAGSYAEPSRSPTATRRARPSPTRPRTNPTRHRAGPRGAAPFVPPTEAYLAARAAIGVSHPTASHGQEVTP